MKSDDRISRALVLIYQYGGIDGTHHKQWLLDQVLRALLGDAYSTWVNSYNHPPSGEEYEEWDVGVAP